jgi:hypothetical protein
VETCAVLDDEDVDAVLDDEDVDAAVPFKHCE